MKRRLMFCTVLFLAVSFCFAQTEVNNEEKNIYVKLLSGAIQNSYDMQMKVIAFLTANGEYHQAKGLAGLNLGADTNFKYEDPQEMNATSLSAEVYLQKDFSFGLNTALSYSMSNRKISDSTASNTGTIALEFQLPLFKSFNNAIAKNEIEKAGYYLDAIKNDFIAEVSAVILKTSELFFNFLIQDTTLEQVKKNKKNLEEQINDMPALIEAGVRSKNDLLEMTVNLEDYKSMILSREAELSQTLTELFLLTGVSFEEILNGVPEFSEIRDTAYLSLSKEDIVFSDEEIKKVVSQSPDIIALKNQVSAAKTSQKIAKIKALPDLNLSFALNTTGSLDSNDFGAFFASPYNNVSGPNIGGQLSFKMGLDRFNAKGLLEVADAQVMKAELDYSTKVKEKTKNIETSIELLNKYRKFSQKANDTLNMNEELHENQVKRFKAGLITVNELFSQDEKLLNANSNFIKLLTAYFMQVLNYKHYTNKLVALTNDDVNNYGTRLFTEE